MKPAAIALLIALAAAPQQVREWDVSGTVTGERGPLRGAFVTISGPLYNAQTQTGAQGNYRVSGVTPGTYTVRMQKLDNTSEAAPRTVTIAAGQSVKLDFQVPRGFIISGRVLDGDKKPVPGVLVTALYKTRRDGQVFMPYKGSDKTNDLGEYRIPYLPAGTYAVTARSPHSPEIRKRAGRRSADQDAWPILSAYPADVVLRSDLHGTDIVLEMRPTHCLLFSAGDAATTVPLSAALYAPTGVIPVQLISGRVESGGSYEICGLVSGDYRLNLGAVTARPYRVASYRTELVTLGKDDRDLGLLTFPSPGEIRGTATAEGVSPDAAFPPVKITLLAQTLPQFFSDTRSARLHPDGTFLMPELFPDDYGVRADGLPPGWYLAGAEQQGRDVLQSGLRPGSGPLRIVFHTDGPSLTGRALTPDGTLVPDATVFLVADQTGETLIASADQSGAWQFVSGISPGGYRLWVAADLTDSERQDTSWPTRVKSPGFAVKLEPKQSQSLDLRIP